MVMSILSLLGKVSVSNDWIIASLPEIGVKIGNLKTDLFKEKC